MENSQSNAPAPAEVKGPETTPALEAAKPVEAPVKHKIKVDGREEELELSDLIKLAQMGKSSQKRFQEAASKREEADKIFEQLKDSKNLKSTLQKLGVDPRKISEEWLSEALREEMLSPEQKKSKTLEDELKRYKDKEEETKKAEDARKMQEMEAKYVKEFDATISAALKDAKVPKSTRTVRMAAEILKTNIQHGLELTPSDIAKMVKDEYITMINETLGDADEDSLLELLGGLAVKLRKADIKRLKTSMAPSTPAQTSKKETPSSQGEKKGMSMEAFRAEMDRLKKGR